MIVITQEEILVIKFALVFILILIAGAVFTLIGARIFCGEKYWRKQIRRMYEDGVLKEE